MSTDDKLLNYIGGEWRASSATEYLKVVNPATAEVMGQVPLSPRLK
jgi:malonate-semialdehyde dehydrogenase (acetylating) / methylmalonate-semialdehyde dehydrogenase